LSNLGPTVFKFSKKIFFNLFKAQMWPFWSLFTYSKSWRVYLVCW